MLLASAAALPLLLSTVGCRSSDAFTGPDPLAGRPPLRPDVLTLQAVIAAEENLIDLYRTAINGGQDTARPRTLRPLLAQHEQHLAQLRARLVVPPGTAATPSPAGTAGTASATGSPAPVSPAPVSPAPVSWARLRTAERASAAALVQQLATVPPALAQLLASIAASDATHVTVLANKGLANKGLANKGLGG
jgi:hypothetical protein